MKENTMPLAQPWDGKGLPTVGTVCEYSLNSGVSWWGCRIEYVVGTQGVVMSCDVDEGVQFVSVNSTTRKFRTIRTPEQLEEELRKRTINQLDNIYCIGEKSHLESICDIYDAIRAGKIKGVKIDE